MRRHEGDGFRGNRPKGRKAGDMSDHILVMEGITKSFPGVRALRSVDFAVERGEVHCLIGANGAGKSTLMKILSGAYHLDEGKVKFDGEDLKKIDTETARRKGIAVIYQELSLVDSMSVAENIFLNNYRIVGAKSFVNWRSLNEKAKNYLHEFNIDIPPESLAGDLSIGHRQLVEILKAVACQAKLIVMDEPSATLSKDEFKALLRIIETLKKRGITIIYISHRLEELFIVGDSLTILRDGARVFSGPIAGIDMGTLVRLMVGHDVVQLERRPAVSGQPTVIELDSVTTDVLKNVSLKVQRSEILGLYGLIGSGRSEVLRAIYGVDRIKSGEIRYHGSTLAVRSPHEAIGKGIGLLPENRKIQGLVLGLPLWENFSMVSITKFLQLGFIRYRKLFDSCKSYVEKLSIRTPSIGVLVGNLSGGNQQKVVISKWLVNDCDLLLVDEPTQGIDVGAKAEISGILDSLSNNGKTIIIVSSELGELLSVANTISVMYEGRLIQTFTGDEINEHKIQECAITGRAS
jgi:ABC-type sugar transport system ATPase subunit